MRDIFKSNKERGDLAERESEEKLIQKQREILEWASKKARVSWLDKRKLAKKVSQHLFDLIDRSGKDLADMIVQKNRVDYETFLNSHVVRSASQVEKLKMDVENGLARANSESELKAARMKSELVKELIETIQKIEDSLPDGKYKEQAVRTIERLVENAINRIETSEISINTEKLFSFRRER